jgi:hypothetical protein
MRSFLRNIGSGLFNLPAAEAECPVLGGQTAVTLTADAALTSLGVSVTPLGAATLDTTGSAAIATFPITGGTENDAQGEAVYLHVGSGLELTDATGTVDLEDFRVDTQNHEIFADLSVDGARSRTIATFLIGPDGELGLTGQAARALDKALGTDALTEDLTLGTASAQPIDDPLSFLLGQPGVCDLSHPALHAQDATGTEPIIDGTSEIDLTSVDTLTSLGIAVQASGFATLDTSGTTPTAVIPVTGGSQVTASGLDRILHQGSGLTLSDTNGSVSLDDFFIDESTRRVFANVTVDGQSVGNLAALRIGHDGSTLLLTGKAASALDEALGTDAFDSKTAIGRFSTDVVAAPNGSDGHLGRDTFGTGVAFPDPHGTI